MQYDYDRIKFRLSEAKKNEIFIMKPVASGNFIMTSLWKRYQIDTQKSQA